MRFLAPSLCSIAVCVLAGCSYGGISPSSPVPAPHYSTAGAMTVFQPFGAVVKSGLYVSEFSATSIFGYNGSNKKNAPPTCTVSNVLYPNDIAVDGKGNLIDPDGGTRSIIIFKGPRMCGPKTASTSDPYGQPIDAASNDALHSTIAIANMMDTGSKPGSITVCTIKAGCTSNLTNPGIFEMVGVAMDTKGNCWASAFNSSLSPTLTYFKRCKGAGVAATGYQNTSPGGLDIDKSGNLVAIDSSGNNIGQIFVYSGCTPTCKLVGGPFALHGEAFWGHLNVNSTAFAAANFQVGEVDVYDYSAKAISYRYSFNNGLIPSLSVKGVAYSPRSKE